MNTTVFAEADALADLADQLTAVSIALYHFRCFNTLSAQEARTIRDDGEVPLDTLANLLRAQAIDQVVKTAQARSADLKAALKHAEGTLEKIKDVKAAIDIAAKVINLGGAVLSGQPKAVLEAIKALKPKTKQPAEAAG
jgi:hypothetical protein